MNESFEKELVIFSEARRLPREPRAAFLDSACAGNPDLRRRVEELLHTADQPHSFMETPASELIGSGISRTTVAPSEKIGDRIGHYELMAQIGEGGCGVVYKAGQEQPVRRSVALKIIKLGMDTKSVIARFEAERQALALMDHPGIAKVLDAGTTDGGRPYFVMELVDGIKITDFCNQHRLSTRARLKLFIQVCQAVQHAHQKGIIHRDLKPSNILVTLTDGVPRPKVIDFGIAKATRGKLSDQTVFTALEQFIGTPAYMSPEQADAREVDIDTRSDIYSLGVLLYELLTGRTPFDAQELSRAGLDQIRRTIREQEPAAPSTQLSTMSGTDLDEVAGCRQTDAPQLIHLVRGDLDWIVMKALEKDRSRRYETTNGLAQDIHRHLENEPVLARPPSRAYRFQKLIRRNRLAFAAGAAIGLALMIGVAISLWGLYQEYQARLEADQLRVTAQANEKLAQSSELKALANEQLAHTDEQKAEDEAAKSRETAQFLEDMLKGVGPSVSQGADTTLLKKILDTTSQRLGTNLTRQPGVEAELRTTLGEVYWEIGDLTNAEAMDRRALELRETVNGTNSAEVADTMGRLSHVLWREGHLVEAESLAMQGINLQRLLFGGTNLDLARSLENYAAILNSKGLGGKAGAVLNEALLAKEALLGHDNLEVADTLDDYGGLLLSMPPTVKSGLEVSEEALAVRTKILGTNNPLVSIATLRLQAAKMDLHGQWDAEEITLSKLVEAKQQLYGRRHPSVAQSLNLLATIYRNDGKLADSEKARREALDIQKTLLGPNNAEVATTLLNLGQLLEAEDKLAEAESLMRRSLEIRRQLFGDGLTLTTTALQNLGDLLLKEGKFDEAINLYKPLADPGSDCAATAQFELGMIYLRGQGMPVDAATGAQLILQSALRGNPQARLQMGMLYFEGRGVKQDEDEALKWFQQAADSANLGTTRSTVFKTLADCYCAAGKPDEAMATLKKICDLYPADSDARVSLAAWQVWFGKTNDFEIMRTSYLRSVSDGDTAYRDEAVSKAYSLVPSSDSEMLAKAVGLARQGVELREGTPGRSWYYLSLGMIEYRSGQYTNAEQDLATAAQTAGKYLDVLPTAGFFRAMCLFRENRVEEARQLFTETTSQMPAPPKNQWRPVLSGKAATHDIVIAWLAWREAKGLLYEDNTLVKREN
ncbi:MAG TPA: tetratricopeptide repeat protein [Candidatus Sulfotelmatobacter sp.]|nr:tetratricopeptide repeat protein [Candidatus Sulfotelmatobacter sp.]